MATRFQHRSVSSRHYESGSGICTIVPPYILRQLAEHGSDQQRTTAFHSLVLSERFRGHREVLGAIRAITPPGEKRRSVYDAIHGTLLPGKLVCTEGGKFSKDLTVVEAYEGAGATYEFFRQIYGRNSVDDHGMRLDSTVHYGHDYDNAFWNGSQMVYGDGDNLIFKRFTRAIDVIGHELTHGVTQHEVGLNYTGQSGALNESFSDVFGSLIKQWVLQQTVDKADWIIGRGLFMPDIHGEGIRSMKAPGTAYDDQNLGKDPQPAHMKDYFSGNDDYGGVHINSGIPSHAFYLLAMELGGFAWEKAGKVWYIVLRDRLRSMATFDDAANMTISVSGELFGQYSFETKAVRNAWREVGVLT